MTRNFLTISIRLAALAAATLLPGMACTYSASAPVVAAGGGNIAVQIYTQPGCSWDVSAATAWTSVISARTGTGNGTVYVYVSPNRGGTRTGYIDDLVYESGSSPVICGRSACGGAYVSIRIGSVTQY